MEHFGFLKAMRGYTAAVSDKLELGNPSMVSAFAVKALRRSALSG